MKALGLFHDGKASDDTLIGGLGDDSYLVDSESDVVTENMDEGDDSVFSSVFYSLRANVENLFLVGSAGIDGSGSAEAVQFATLSSNPSITGQDFIVASV